MFCQKCGSQINKDARFCRNCGAAVNDISEQVQAANNSHYTNSSNSVRSFATSFTIAKKLQFIAIALVFLSLILLFLPAFKLDANLWGVSAQDLYDYGYVEDTAYGDPFVSQSFSKLISDFDDSTMTAIMIIYIIIHVLIAGLIVKELIVPSINPKNSYITGLILSTVILISYISFTIYLADLVREISFDIGDFSLVFGGWLNIAV